LCLLLRAGEEKLAEELVRCHSDLRKDLEDVSTHYATAAHGWAWHTFQRALWAHTRGDDTIALHDFRTFASVANLLETEARKRGWKPDPAGAALLEFTKPDLPHWLADQTRRAGHPHASIVCLGPGRESDAPRRIAALIDRLDEVGVLWVSMPN